MSNIDLLDDFSFPEYIDYIYSVISYYEIGNEDEYLDIKKDLRILEKKINDETLYLGVVGSFSSGKSTFINSIMHKNLLPTDAVQGTTVTTSILKKAEYDDLEIVYTDETIKKFSECTKYLINKYQISVNHKEEYFIFKKFINWLKQLFELVTLNQNKEKESCYRNELFKKVISTEEIAKDIQYVTLYYKNENIPYRIAMVDTPGTESLNNRHNEVTKNAINNICDAIVVIIPYDKPVSEDLLDYINSNLESQKKECIFVITKVELLEDRDELPRLIRIIKRRLENGLSIESACVIPMPTFIYLKSVDFDMKTTFLDNISEDDKNNLISLYEEGIEKINELLNNNKSRYIKKKIIDICERVNLKLKTNLLSVVNSYTKKNKKLQDETVLLLEKFENKAKNEIIQYANLNRQKVDGEINFIHVKFSELCSEVERALNECNDSYDILTHMNFSTMFVFDEIIKIITNYLYNLQNGFNSKIQDIQKNFIEEYVYCHVEGRKNDISIDVHNFLEKDFIDECEMLFQERIRMIESTIRSDMNGFIKRIKLFFASSFNKHKEITVSNLLDEIEQIEQKVYTYIADKIKAKVAEVERNSKNAINAMINNDRYIIESYINRTQLSMENNNREKNSTQVCIDKLNQYITILKEDA